MVYLGTSFKSSNTFLKRGELVLCGQWLMRELRADIAEEAGAVAIYRGILTVTRDLAIRMFLETHLATELEHVSIISSLLPKDQHSASMPVWRIASFLTSVLPSLIGNSAVYLNFYAVE